MNVLPYFVSFLSELEKIAASKHRLTIPKMREGRRSMSVDTLLRKDREQTLFKEAAETEYKLQGHATHQGLPIAIENRKGSVRSGVDDDGKPWRTKFEVPYGYIKGTKGKDGEEIDAFVGPDKAARDAYVVHQRKADGTGHDEDKVMLGFPSKSEAKATYLKHYDDPKFLGPISTIRVLDLKARLAKSREQTKLAGLHYPYASEADRPEPKKRGDVPSRDGITVENGKAERSFSHEFAATEPVVVNAMTPETGASPRY